jgi:hypothetical protein
MDGRAWPSWSAIARADKPASSRIVAHVFRNMWEVTQVKPAVPRAVRRSRDVLLGSRQPPNESGNTGPLEADDAHGEEHELITQHYGIKRPDLAALIELAATGVDGRHAVPGKLHQDCPNCAAVFALGRIRNALDWTTAPDRRSSTS